MLVVSLAIRIELDAQRGDVEPMRIAAEVDAAFQVGVDFRRLEPTARLVDRELERREAQIDHALEHFLRREIGEALNGSTNEHQVAPSKIITSDKFDPSVLRACTLAALAGIRQHPRIGASAVQLPKCGEIRCFAGQVSVADALASLRMAVWGIVSEAGKAGAVPQSSSAGGAILGAI